MAEQITITNPTRRRKWGFGWSCTPTGNGPYSIEPPAEPDYTGTLSQVQHHIGQDRTYHSMKSGGTLINAQWFYNGQMLDKGNMIDFLSELHFRREEGKPPPKSVTIRTA